MQITLNYNIPRLFVIAQDSICQDLAPSPTLEPFLDSLPIPPTIPVNLSQLVIGAYKITQVIPIIGVHSFQPYIVEEYLRGHVTDNEFARPGTAESIG
jgi:hypothetical protein